MFLVTESQTLKTFYNIVVRVLYEERKRTPFFFPNVVYSYQIALSEFESHTYCMFPISLAITMANEVLRHQSDKASFRSKKEIQNTF